MGKRLDRAVQILQGRRKERLPDAEFWRFIARVAKNEDKYTDTKYVSSRLRTLYESIGAYLMRLVSMQERIHNFHEIGVMLAILENALLTEHSNYHKALESRGVYKAFEDYILNHSPEEDITLMSLAFCKLFGYRNCHCCFRKGMVADHKERYASSLAKCMSASAELHPFLRLGLAFAFTRIIRIPLADDVSRENLKATDDICKLLVLHGAASFAVQELACKGDDPFESKSRKIIAIDMLLKLRDICPSFVEGCRTDQAIECAVYYLQSLASEKTFTASSVSEFCQDCWICLAALGRKNFDEKLVPRIVPHLSDNFLIQFYRNPDWFREDHLGAFEPARIFFRMGRFNAHQQLAPVVVDLFKKDRISVSRRNWDFLHDVYAVPVFKEEYFKNIPGGCDLITLEILRSVLSTHWVPYHELSDTVHFITMETQAVRNLEDAQVSVVEVLLETCPRCRLASLYLGQCAKHICQFRDPTWERRQDLLRFHFQIDITAVLRERRSDRSLTGEMRVEKAAEKGNRAPEVKGSIEEQASHSATVEEDSSSMLLSCNACGRRADDLMLCGRCQQVKYCNRDCQKADWKKSHKAECTKPQ